MPRPALRDGQTDFRGGLNLAADDDALAPNELRRADEVTLSEFGAAKKRAGMQRLSDTPMGSAGGQPIQGGYSWQRDNGTQQLLAVADGQLHTAAYGIPTTWTARTGALHASNPVSAVAFRDASSEVVYLADGDAAAPGLNKWNGTAVTTNLASTPNGISQLAVYNQRLFGCTGTDQKIWWSALNNGDTLGQAANGGGEAVIRTFSDQNVTTVAPFGSSLLIFHVSGISRFTGYTQDDIQIQAGAQGLTGDVGAIAPRSLVQTPEGIYFLSDRGFYVATETQVAPISLKIDPFVRKLDLSATSAVVGVHAKWTREVWWFLPDRGVYRYNYALQAWTGPCAGGYLTTPTTALFEAIDDEYQPIVLVGDEAGFVKHADKPGIYRDNVPTTGAGGASYALAVRCRRLFFGDPMQFKQFKWMYLQAALRSSTQATVTWLSTYGQGQYTLPNADGAVAEWGTGRWGTGVWGGGAAKPIRVPINGGGPHLDVLITDGGDGQSVWSRVEVDGFDYGRRY